MGTDKTGHIAAPVSCALNKRTYTFSPLTMADFKELERWLQSLPLQRLKDSLDGLPDQAVELLVKEANEERKAIKLGTSAFDEAAATSDGIQFMLWLSLRRRHPEVELEGVLDLMTEENMPELHRVVSEMSGKAEDSDPTKTARK